MSLNQVQIKSTIKDSWNTGFGALLSIKNNSKNNFTKWQIIVTTKSKINWCDNLKITSITGKIILEPQSYCPPLQANSELIINYGGEGKMPTKFTFKAGNPEPTPIPDPVPNPEPKPNPESLPTPSILNKKVFGYFSEWSIYGRKFSVEQIPVNNLTHIVYAFMLPNPNQSDYDIFKKNSSFPPLPYYPPPQKLEASLVTHDEYANQINIEKLKTLKQKNPNIKILTTNTKKYVKSILKLFNINNEICNTIQKQNNICFFLPLHRLKRKMRQNYKK